jgi:hypothetical protein
MMVRLFVCLSVVVFASTEPVEAALSLRQNQRRYHPEQKVGAFFITKDAITNMNIIRAQQMAAGEKENKEGGWKGLGGQEGVGALVA